MLKMYAIPKHLFLNTKKKLRETEIWRLYILIFRNVWQTLIKYGYIYMTYYNCYLNIDVSYYSNLIQFIGIICGCVLFIYSKYVHTFQCISLCTLTLNRVVDKYYKDLLFRWMAIWNSCRVMVDVDIANNQTSNIERVSL